MSKIDAKMIKILTKPIPVWYLYATIFGYVCFSVGVFEGYFNSV